MQIEVYEAPPRERATLDSFSIHESDEDSSSVQSGARSVSSGGR
jgi:hypothetical protein